MAGVCFPGRHVRGNMSAEMCFFGPGRLTNADVPGRRIGSGMFRPEDQAGLRAFQVSGLVVRASIDIGSD
jgi:hypothetical protein